MKGIYFIMKVCSHGFRYFLISNSLPLCSALAIIIIHDLTKCFILFFFFHLFLLVGSQPFHNIAVGFVIHWHESAMELHVFPILIPPPTSLATRFLWVFPVHQARALVSCILPGLVICFTIDNVHAVLSKHPTLAFSHRAQKSVLYICVSFSVLHIGLSSQSF